VPLRIRAARDRIRLRGRDCLDFLQRMSTADLRGLEPGAGMATVFVTEKARILDVACLLRTGAEEVELLLSPGAGEVIWRWLRQHHFTEDLELAPPERWTGMELHGIRSAEELSALLGKELRLPQRLAWGDWAMVELEGIPVHVVAVPGLRAHGVALLAAESVHEELERRLAGIPTGDEPTAEALRILAGIGRWGAEWRQEYNPFEAGLGGACQPGQGLLRRARGAGAACRPTARCSVAWCGCAHGSHSIPACSSFAGKPLQESLPVLLLHRGSSDGLPWGTCAGSTWSGVLSLLGRRRARSSRWSCAQPTVQTGEPMPIVFITGAARRLGGCSP
jgi:hypothetical protein